MFGLDPELIGLAMNAAGIAKEVYAKLPKETQELLLDAAKLAMDDKTRITIVKKIKIGEREYIGVLLERSAEK